jgi:hypothetical protein
MTRTIASLLSVLSLAGCDAMDTMTDGISHSQAVSEKLESSLGLKSHVGFQWNNGSLKSVTVTFEGLPNSPGLPEISAQVQRAVSAEFKQTPKTIVVAFTLSPVNEAH